MSEEELCNIIANPWSVTDVIGAINSGLVIPYPHNLESYFIYGHCNVYAEILQGVFGNFATVYIDYDKAHVITKIGEYYYDVLGICTDISGELGSIEKDYIIDIPLSGIGTTKTEKDDELIEKGIMIGKEKLEEIKRNQGLSSR